MTDRQLTFDRPRGLGWVVSATVFVILTVTFLFGSFYVVDTGHVGVERTLGKVDLLETEPGMNFKMPLLTTAYEFSAKEIALDLNDLKPKAADNLSLQDLDVTVYYNAAPHAIADLMVKYANASQSAPGAILPAYGIVYREARGAVYEEVAKVDSLELHKLRDALQASIQESLQARLTDKDGDALQVSRVVVRALNTDPSIEASIREAVANQKKLEAKQISVDIAVKDAEIEIERARGIAEANRIINESLTAQYLQHEINVALQAFAENEGQVVVMPANMQGFDVILDTQRFPTNASE
ncbi:MAG: SPFH domain-containing protein [Gammaproteobacteria bacterium]|nr:SPFH domain-containing protein [Gammaproteobacteria bacterium]